MKGEHLGISVLLGKEYIEESEKLQPSSYNLPDINSLKLSVEAFKKSDFHRLRSHFNTGTTTQLYAYVLVHKQM